MKRFAATLLALVLSACAATVALADPPGRVGRVATLAGEVMVAHAGGEWRAVGMNYPLTDGDNIYVSPDGRMEIDFGTGLAWLSGGATVYFERLDDQHFRARLTTGQMMVRIRDLDRGETARIDTRAGGVDITTPGLYRIESNASGGADMVHVKFGSAELSTNAGFESLRAGDAVEFDGYRVGFLNIRGSDSFDAWADARDRRYENHRFAYVSPRMVGWRDLDDHGAWRETGTYGWVWYPRRVGADWAPYRYGNWSYVAPWGWTWVDDAPWGFAPFHYGRWVNLNGRWGWCPGAWERRPVYSPALVAWHGGAPGVSVNVSVGSGLVYWTPLAWGEAYYPTYTVSANYWRLQNRAYIHPSVQYAATAPTGHQYRNWSAPNGYTAVEAAVVASARPVAVAAQAYRGVTLPSTQQMENFPVQDRIKPAYAGAPVYAMTPRSNNATVQAPATVPLAAPNRAMGAMNPATPVWERATAPTVPANVQQNFVRPPQGVVSEAGRPAPAEQARQNMPQQSTPLMQPARPTGVAPVEQARQSVPTQVAPVPPTQVQQAPQPVRAMPSPAMPAPAAQQAPAPVVQPAPMLVPPQQPPQQRMAPVTEASRAAPQPPQMVAPLPPAAQQGAAEQGARRVAPAQGRGEARIERQDRVFVEPMPKAPARVVAPPTVNAPQPPAPQGDQVRRAVAPAPVEQKPDQRPQR
jgi:hypothetical protein